QQRLYGNLTQREAWLESLQEHLRSCGWVAAECHEWDDADLEILGPGPYTARLCSLYEEDLENARYYVRYRITARPKAVLPFVILVLAGALGVCLSTPVFWPLAIPALYALRLVTVAKRSMIRAVSQLAIDCGEALGMTRVEDPYQ
ncbi:MAG TPA: hypothetical protein VGH74_20690, partial [Planctomycetaceae bacterium]